LLLAELWLAIALSTWGVLGTCPTCALLVAMICMFSRRAISAFCRDPSLPTPGLSPMPDEAPMVRHGSRRCSIRHLLCAGLRRIDAAWTWAICIGWELEWTIWYAHDPVGRYRATNWATAPVLLGCLLPLFCHHYRWVRRYDNAYQATGFALIITIFFECPFLVALMFVLSFLMFFAAGGVN
jgi:hypothetical protein